MLLDANYVALKNQVIKAERNILKVLGFVVHVNHPHKLIYAYIYSIRCSDNTELVCRAWNYMNDGLRTDIFLRYRPETIACACVFLAARTIMDPVPLPEEPFHWFELYGVSDRDVEQISRILLALYTRNRAPSWNRLALTLKQLRNPLGSAGTMQSGNGTTMEALGRSPETASVEEKSRRGRERSTGRENSSSTSTRPNGKSYHRDHQAAMAMDIPRRYKSPPSRDRKRDSYLDDNNSRSSKHRHKHHKDRSKEHGDRDRDKHKSSTFGGRESSKKREREVYQTLGKSYSPERRKTKR